MVKTEPSQIFCDVCEEMLAADDPRLKIDDPVVVCSACAADEIVRKLFEEFGDKTPKT